MAAWAVVVLLVAGCGGGAQGSPSPSQPSATRTATQAAGSDFESVCAAGTGEGEVVYYGTFTPEIFDGLVAPFRERFPGIEVSLLPGRPDELVQRVVTEVGAGQQPDADIVRGDADLLTLLDRDLIATDINWASLGVDEDLVNTFGAVRSFRVMGGLAYNTDLVEPDELPSTWDALVDPAWAGKIVVDPRGYPLSYLAITRGQEDLLEYAAGFRDTLQPIWIEGITAGLLAVASGEGALTTTARDAEVMEQQAAGAPVEIHYLDLIPAIDNYGAVLTVARHPNAAQCLLAWMASEEGQALELELEYKSNENVPPDAPEGSELIVLDTPEKSRLEADSRTKVAAVLRGE